MKFNPYQTENPTQSSQSGQIAVVILLVVVVMATLGLSELGQTTEDIFVSSQKEEATRVFNAAETGVEEALSDEGNFGSNPVTVDEGLDQPGLEADVTVSPETSFRSRIIEGETATVDLDGASSTVTVRFGAARTCAEASLMMAVYSTSGDTRYYYVSPQNCSNRGGDDFAVAGSTTVNGFQNTYSISGIDESVDELLRITPLYASTELEVVGLGLNTVQSHTVRSTARLSDQPENTIEQIIEVERSIPAAPSYMNYVLYSNGTIQHAP